jgi:hypothetical protein
MENTTRANPVRTPTEEDWLVASKDVDSEKIRWAIEGFGYFKSAGEDTLREKPHYFSIILIIDTPKSIFFFYFFQRQ